MSRSGSAGRSFLDDLLADESDKPLATPKRKSVHFMEKDDENSDIFGTDLMSSLSSRQTSAKDKQRNVDPLEGSKTDTTPPGSRQASAPKTSASKSDWLGLGSDDEPDRPIAHGFQEKTQKASIDQKDDWLNSGLSARKNRSANDALEKSEDNSWLSIRKRAEESKFETNEQKILTQNETIDKKVSNVVKAEPELKPNISTSTVTVKASDNAVNSTNMETDGQIIDTISTSLNTSSVMLLQTQIKMLELEKTYLQQTLDQIKTNHNEELKIMTALHEQQMRMTTDMYKRHEEMVQEERDRRINDLKVQLSQSEKDMEDMRRRNNQRVVYLESEWQREVERLKDMHSSTTAKLTEQHEQDLSRIRKIKEQEIESVNALQNHGLSLESLLSKWERSAQQIEELHRNVISKQEEILKQKFTDIEVKNKRLDEVEVNWHSLINELEVERNRCTGEQKKLYDIIEKQKQLLESEQKRVIEERLDVESDRRKLSEEKQTFGVECNQIRDKIRKESEIVSEERLKLKDEFTNLEAKRNAIDLEERDSKVSLNREKDELKRLFKDIEDKRNELHRDERELQHQLMVVHNEQHSLEQRKLMFDVEKHKMQDLAQEIAKRAEELESLSEIALHEKREGHMAMDEAERFRKELDSKLKFIEESFAQLRSEEERVNKNKAKVDQELEYIKETKDNIVCNLCGSGLNRVKLNSATKTSFPDFNSFSTYYPSNQWPGMQDNDRALLIWQITGQQDAALLQEETAFINGIRAQTQTTGISFQQNDYIIN